MFRAVIPERDFVMRMVKQLADAIARALKLANAAKPEEARTALEQGCGAALGMEYRVLAMLDARSAVELLGTPERAQAFVTLVEAMGHAEVRGGTPGANRHALHAQELRAAAQARWPGRADSAR